MFTPTAVFSAVFSGMVRMSGLAERELRNFVHVSVTRIVTVIVLSVRFVSVAVGVQAVADRHGDGVAGLVLEVQGGLGL